MARGPAAVIVVLLLIAGIAYWWRQQPPVAPQPAEAPPETVAPAAPAGPQFPVEPPTPAAGSDLAPLPPLSDSDEYLKLELKGLFGDSVARLAVSEALVEKLVATIDALPRRQLAARIRPVVPLDTAFIADAQDSSGEYWLGPANFARYDALVSQFAAADIDAAVDLYRRYYPLFQQAYEGLGYPDGYFNDRLVSVIDHLLATPDVTGPIALTRPHVLYEFADPELAALSSGQKLMLRIGPSNRERVATRLKRLRDQLAGG